MKLGLRTSNLADLYTLAEPALLIPHALGEYSQQGRAASKVSAEDPRRDSDHES